MRGRACLLAAAVAAIVCLGPQLGTASAAGCPGETMPAAAVDQVSFERAVFCLINQDRVAAGRRALRGNARLQRAAAGYAGSMVSGGFFSHTSPGGTTVISRLRSSGYIPGNGTWEVGENLLWATGPLSSPASIVDSWMHSPVHRENLLESSFRELGVGAVSGTPFASLPRPVSVPPVSVPTVPLPTGPLGIQVVAPEDPGVTVATEYGVRKR